MVLIHTWFCWQLLELVADVVEPAESNCVTETKSVADDEAVGESAEVVRTSEPDKSLLVDWVRLHDLVCARTCAPELVGRQRPPRPIVLHWQTTKEEVVLLAAHPALVFASGT